MSNIKLKTSSFVNSHLDLDKNKYCLISGELFTEAGFANHQVYKLKCGHSFNYKNLLLAISLQNESIYTYRRCPFCLSISDRVPFKIFKKIMY